MFFRRIAVSVLAALLLASANAAPPPGHPSAEQAVEILGVLPKEAASSQNMRYAGIVMSARDSNAFTFIEVKNDGANASSRWIAAPRTSLVPGDRIRFDDGRLMTNFYSRKHDITFESITFVNRVVREEPK